MLRQKPLLFGILVLAVLAAALTTWYQRRSFVHDDTIFPSQSEPTRPGVMQGESQVGKAINPMGTEPDLYPVVPPDFPDDERLEIRDRVYQQYASHQVVVTDVSAYLQQMREYVLSINGRVLNSSQNSHGRYRYGYLSVRVPVDKFAEATGRVTQNVEQVVSESVNAVDQTAATIAAQERVQELQDQIAQKEIDLLAATTEVERRRVQLEIERLRRQLEAAQQGEQKEQQQVEYATLEISASNDARYFNSSARPTLSEELRSAWESLGDILYVLAYFLIWLVVYSVVWLPLVLVGRWVLRRVRRDEVKK